MSVSMDEEALSWNWRVTVAPAAMVKLLPAEDAVSWLLPVVTVICEEPSDAWPLLVRLTLTFMLLLGSRFEAAGVTVIVTDGAFTVRVAL